MLSFNTATKQGPQNQELLDFVARRLYEMAAVNIMSHLIIQDATKAPELFAKSAQEIGRAHV